MPERIPAYSSLKSQFAMAVEELAQPVAAGGLVNAGYRVIAGGHQAQAR